MRKVSQTSIEVDAEGIKKVRSPGRTTMNPKAVKLVSIVALSAMFSWWFAAEGLTWSVRDGGYMELYSLVVFVAALVLIAITVHGRKYFWAAGFALIAVLFNPFAPFALSRITFLVLDAVCIAVFLVSLAQSWTKQKKQARTRQAV
jgi:hypothetical protein